MRLCAPGAGRFAAAAGSGVAGNATEPRRRPRRPGIVRLPVFSRQAKGGAGAQGRSRVAPAPSRYAIEGKRFPPRHGG